MPVEVEVEGDGELGKVEEGGGELGKLVLVEVVEEEEEEVGFEEEEGVSEGIV